MDEIEGLFGRLRQGPFSYMKGGSDDINATAYETQAQGLFPSGFLDDFDRYSGDFVLYTVYNGTFTIAPKGKADSTLNATSNILPGWAGPFTVSGTAGSSKWVTNGSPPPTNNLRLLMAAGAAGDEIYHEQFVPVPPSTLGHGPVAVHIDVHSLNFVSLEFYAKVQFFLLDKATSTGSEDSVSIAFNALDPTETIVLHPAAGLTPSNAIYLRIRLGIKRAGAAIGVTGSADVFGVRTMIGLGEVLISNISDPIGNIVQPGRLWKDAGVLILDQDLDGLGARLVLDQAGPSFSTGISGAVLGADLTISSGGIGGRVLISATEGLYLSGGLVGGNVMLSAVTVNQNNFATDSGTLILRFTGVANFNLTGLNCAPGNEEGRVLLLENASASTTITIPHNSASSSSFNRFSTPNGSDFSLGPNQLAIVVYDEDAARWRISGQTTSGGGGTVVVNNNTTSPTSLVRTYLMMGA